MDDTASAARAETRAVVQFGLALVGFGWLAGSLIGGLIGGFGVALGYATAGEVEAE